MLAASALAVLPVSMAGATPGNSKTVSASMSRTVGKQRAELASSDGGSPDSFGSSVAISGNTAVFGASNHNVGSNTGQGAAYVFTRTGSTWSQAAELTASDGAASDSFGWSVAIKGTTVIVGAIGHKVGTNGQGAAYVFTRTGSTWSQTAELTASDGAASDFFGYAVAISGKRAVVGAPEHKVGSNSLQGAAYVFTRTGSTWIQTAELTASDGAGGDNFGTAVAVLGKTAVVGAAGHIIATGAAYVFTKSGTTWSQTAELTASDGAINDFFGSSAAISGNAMIVGAGGHRGGYSSGHGAAYVFTKTGSTWSQTAELTASDGAVGDHFGFWVAISTETAIVGAYEHQVGSNTQQGAAYLFTQTGSTWSQTAELTASDGAAYDNFGHSVAISGRTMVVGAPGHQVGSNSEQGAAYVFGA